MPAYTNARQHLPTVFEAIIKNQRAREELRDLSIAGLMTREHWHKLRDLVEDAKNLRSGAEKALRWNTDKGNACN